MLRLVSRFGRIARRCAPLSLAGVALSTAALSSAALTSGCTTSAAERAVDPDTVEIPAFDSVTILQLPDGRRTSPAPAPTSAPEPTAPSLSPLADSISEGLVFKARTQH